MIRVLVKDAAVSDRSGTKNGKPWHMRTQVAWAQLPAKPYPVEISITLQGEQAAFAIGEYELGAECVWVSRYGELQFDIGKMKAVSRPQVAQARAS
jgi:hypothetical protein